MFSPVSRASVHLYCNTATSILGGCPFGPIRTAVLYLTPCLCVAVAVDTRYTFVVVIGALCCITIGPILWYGWLYSGTANSNFYFAITLVAGIAQTIMMSDIGTAHLRLSVVLSHGRQAGFDDLQLELARPSKAAAGGGPSQAAT